MTLHCLIIAVLITIPVFATWTPTLDNEDVKLWKMWIKLAWNGYAEPMKVNQSREKPWWNFWD